MKKLNLFLLIYKLNCTIKQIACKKTNPNTPFLK